LRLHHRLVDGVGTAHVLHHGTHVDGDGGRCRHLTADDGIDELLLAALRVFLCQRYHHDTWVGSSFRVMRTDGLRLDLLDAYITFVDLHGGHEQLQAHKNLIGMFHHQPVVGGDVGLTLHAVEDDTLGLGRGRRHELDMGGESGTAHTGHTGSLHTTDDLLGGELRVCGQRLQRV
jgi:hypothetical protein